MVGHPVDGDQLLSLIPDNASDVFVKVFLELLLDQGLSLTNSEDSLNVDLGEGVCHEEPHITLLKELGRPQKNQVL